MRKHCPISYIMQELIKKIRSHMNMNQTDFAEQLNVTFATVNRWENGRALPNKLAQDKIYDLCQKYDVPVYDMVLEKIETASRSIELEKGRVLLYHGSKSGIVGDIAPKSRKQCDFGEGFYMGTEPSQALTLICDYENAKFYIVSISIEGLDILDVPADLEWAMIVAYHRGRMKKKREHLFTINRMQWAGEEYLLEEVMEAAGDKLSEKGEVYSKDVIYWIGYIYRYWHYYTEESSKAIYKQAPVETMKRNYLMFHTMAPEVAIEDLKEIYRQKERRFMQL